MDWSLVLASQAISTIIQHTEQEGWHLLVEPEDQPRAVAAIRQFRRENLHWFWRRSEVWPDFHFDTRAWVWCFYLIAVHLVTTTSFPAFRQAALMDSGRASAGEWWRICTAMLLHVDPAHLLANVCFGFVLFGLAMANYGAGLGLLASYAAGAAGNIAGWAIYPDAYRSMGASGMVMGALGLMAVHSIAYWRRQQLHGSRAFKALASGVLLFLLLGLDPNTDVLAHLGGFIAGVLIGGALIALPEKAFRNKFVQLMAGIIFVTLVLGTAVIAALRLAHSR